MSAIRTLRNVLVFHIIFRNRQTLSGKLSSFNYIRNLCHQLWHKFIPDEKLQQMIAELLLHCNSLTIGERNMQYHLRLMGNSLYLHFRTAHHKEHKAQPQCGTRMTRIGPIFTDPCKSASTAQSVFHHVCSSLKNPASGAVALIRVHLLFFNNVIFQTGLTGLTGYVFNPVHPVILSNSKRHLSTPRQSANLMEGGVLINDEIRCAQFGTDFKKYYENINRINYGL